ncbi:MAG: UDP-N-acetylglucosamine 1-carboxyvinyltransferase [Deltaproteobacteria bacterium]|nr:UDP-N-acetylglucosamine 1-carboxyvinyltransferase [Deltaproteobacteria bacterium]
MASFIVEGGVPLSGEITPAGNKNEALPILAASLLPSSPVTLKNIPHIGDIHQMIQVLQGLGAKIMTTPDGDLEIDPSGVCDNEPDQAICTRIRASFLLAGPLLARRGHLMLPRPGGDRIGRRRLDTHVLALKALGADVSISSAYHLSATQGLRGAEIFLDEASVMATENALMAAVAAKGESIIYNAACEPHVQGLCRFLSGMGAQIDGIGSNVLTIRGVSDLHGCEHRVMSDHIEIGSFIGLAAVTGGEIVIRNVEPENLRMIRMAFRRLGVQILMEGTTLTVPPNQQLSVKCDLGGAIPRIDDAPWPGFPADLTSIALVTATQASGTVIVHEKMFESRLFFVDSLTAMGAKVVLCDPHRAVVIGPADLYGCELSSPDIRAGMALLIAALSAKGRSVIHNIRQIDRGYENIDGRLRQLGARIDRVLV